MALGEKLFEEAGKITSIKVEDVHPVEGVKMEVSFASDVKGTGNFPSGMNMGSGTMRQYPHGIANAEYRGVLTTEKRQQFLWWAHEKYRIGQDDNARGVIIVSGFTNAEELKWMNDLIIVMETEFNPAKLEFRGTGYQWK